MRRVSRPWSLVLLGCLLLLASHGCSSSTRARALDAAVTGDGPAGSGGSATGGISGTGATAGTSGKGGATGSGGVGSGGRPGSGGSATGGTGIPDAPIGPDGPVGAGGNGGGDAIAGSGGVGPGTDAGSAGAGTGGTRAGDAAATGGVGGTGGSSGSGGAATGGAGGTGGGGRSGSGGVATGGAGGTGGSSTQAPQCPAAPPGASACAPEGLWCAYDACPAAGRTTAYCSNGTWSVTTGACGMVRCYDQYLSAYCNSGEICTVAITGARQAGCLANSCGTGPLTLDCLSYYWISSGCNLTGGVNAGFTVYCNECGTTCE